MFEREGDTKYKSVCNSEDFQQRGANFLDWSEKLDLCVTILLISTEYILHFVVTAFFLYFIKQILFPPNTSLVWLPFLTFLNVIFFPFRECIRHLLLWLFLYLTQCFSFFQQPHLTIMSFLYKLFFLFFFLPKCSTLLAAFPSKCQGR